MLSLGQAILRGDREALALAVVIVVGVVLLRRGTETLGAVFLSLVFGDFLVWTMWAAMNNLRHRRGARGRSSPGRAGRAVAVGAGRLLGGARPAAANPRRAGWPSP